MAKIANHMKSLQIGLILAFCSNPSFSMKKGDVLESFWVPIPHVVPRKQHVLRFGSLVECIGRGLKMKKNTFFSLWAYEAPNLKGFQNMAKNRLKTLKTCSFDQKLQNGQRNFLKNVLGRFWQNSIFWYFWSFWHIFSLLAGLNVVYVPPLPIIQTLI